MRLRGRGRAAVRRARRAVETLLRRSWRAANGWDDRRFRRRVPPGGPPVVVFQMGSVGSSAVHGALEGRLGGRPLFHVHSLTDRGVERLERIYREHARARGATAVDDHLLASRYLRRRRRKRPEERWKVVTLTRDPVARNLSSFFNAYPLLFPDLAFDDGAGSDREARERMSRRPVEALERVFLERFEHERPLRWFDWELEPVTGVRVYERPFPKERGWDVYEGDRADVLLIRQEDLEARGPEALGRFLGVELRRLGRRNTAGDKAYADAYRAFKERLRLPRSYEERMYGSRYARHFYREDEIARFRARWRIAEDPGGPGAEAGARPGEIRGAEASRRARA